ncbi:hypothetical protein ACWEGQ_28105 [Streptomyces seoulensis]
MSEALGVEAQHVRLWQAGPAVRAGHATPASGSWCAAFVTSKSAGAPSASRGIETCASAIVPDASLSHFPAPQDQATGRLDPEGYVTRPEKAESDE